ncbi:MAG: hypothetical protein ACLU6W_09945 [Lachnospiraceae bacterium]
MGHLLGNTGGGNDVLDLHVNTHLPMIIGAAPYGDRRGNDEKPVNFTG